MPRAPKKKVVARRARPKARARVPASRSRADTVLTQGVGATTKHAFGSSRKRSGRGGANLHVWDAKLPQHLALPRAVGPYAVIRTTRRFDSVRTVEVFGTYLVEGDTGSLWTNICSIEGPVGNAAINDVAGNAYTHVYSFTNIDKAATVCPSAFSVQVMNPESLSATSGIIYAGVLNTQSGLAGRTETWDGYADKFVQYQSPRLLSSGKLALRGVQINSMPLNMTYCSLFAETNAWTDSTFVWGVTSPQPRGWAPIMVYNPGGTKLEYLVTTEWRVRFDLDNPASAAHRQHRAAPDRTWDDLMTKAVAIGNGCIDIADKVANAGQLAGRVAAALF